MNKQFYVYILTNRRKTVLYTGITNNLERRMVEHKSGLVKGFTKRYNLNRLVWFESLPDAQDAIRSEKRIKRWIRKKKIELIEEMNPEWKDLSESF